MGQEIVFAGEAQIVEGEDVDASVNQIIAMVSAQFEGLRPDEVTVRMYMEMEQKCGNELRYNQAANRLNRLVEMGLMRKRLVVHDGARRMAFSWIGGRSDGDR